MTLEEYERALLQLGFAPDGAPQPLAGFGLYRQLIRARLFAMAQVAYRRAFALLGAAPCAASFARYLAARPPASPLLREVIAGFGAFAEHDRALLEAAPPFARDLLRFEAAKWRAADAPAPREPALCELSFEGVLALNPTLSLLSLEHALADQPEPPFAHDPHGLLIYRRDDDDEVRWYRAPRLLCELLALPGRTERSLADLTRELLRAREPAAHEQTLSELASALAVAVERGVILGVTELRASA